MRTPNSPESAASLLKEAQELVETRLEYAKLSIIDKSAEASGSVIFILIAFLIAVCFLLTVSLALAVFISVKTGSKPSGFFAVGLFYLLVLIIVYVFKDKFIRSPMTNLLINKLMK